MGYRDRLRKSRCTAIPNDLVNMDWDSTRSLSICLISLSLSYCSYISVSLFVCRGPDSSDLLSGMLCWWPEWLQWWILPCTYQWQGYLEYFPFDCRLLRLATHLQDCRTWVSLPEQLLLPAQEKDEKEHIYNRTYIYIYQILISWCSTFILGPNYCKQLPVFCRT